MGSSKNEKHYSFKRKAFQNLVIFFFLFIYKKSYMYCSLIKQEAFNRPNFLRVRVWTWFDLIKFGGEGIYSIILKHAMTFPLKIEIY